MLALVKQAAQSERFTQVLIAMLSIPLQSCTCKRGKAMIGAMSPWTYHLFRSSDQLSPTFCVVSSGHTAETCLFRSSKRMCMLCISQGSDIYHTMSPKRSLCGCEVIVHVPWVSVRACVPDASTLYPSLLSARLQGAFLHSSFALSCISASLSCLAWLKANATDCHYSRVSDASSLLSQCDDVPSDEVMYLFRAIGSPLLMDPNKVCRRLRRLRGRRSRICRRQPEVVEEVHKGVAKATKECQFQFKDRRWNCTTNRRSLKKILLKGWWRNRNKRC